VRTVLYADEHTVQLAAGCLLAQGHLLVEDLPGLGKTTLAKALSQSLGLDFTGCSSPPTCFRQTSPAP